MRKNRRIGSVLLCFSFNLLLNLRWSIPAWIALALHLWLGVSAVVHRRTGILDPEHSRGHVACGLGGRMRQ